MHVNHLFPLVSVSDADVDALRLLNPMVLHLIFLFQLLWGSWTRWCYVWLMPRGFSTQRSYTCCFYFGCPRALQLGGLMFDWCLRAFQLDGLTHAVTISVAPGLFNPMVLYLLFLFRLPRDSSTRWSYVWLMPRGSSTRWSYTWCFCFGCPRGLQLSGIMFDWCLRALQPDGLTLAVSVLVAPRLFNPMVLCLIDASRLFNLMVLHLLFLFLMPWGSLTRRSYMWLAKISFNIGFTFNVNHFISCSYFVLIL